jgi:hypothetical protein
MRLVPFDAPVPEWSPGGSYGHSRLLSCSFVLWPAHLVPGDGSPCGHMERSEPLAGVSRWPSVVPDIDPRGVWGYPSTAGF